MHVCTLLLDGVHALLLYCILKTLKLGYIVNIFLFYFIYSFKYPSTCDIKGSLLKMEEK